MVGAGAVRSPPIAPTRALATLAAFVLAAAACGDDGGGDSAAARADQAREAAAEAGPPDDIAEVLAVAATGPDGTYRVTYELAAPNGGTTTVTVTQRPPDRRVDTTSPDGTVDVSLAVDGVAYSCTDPAGDQPPRCTEVGEPSSTGVFDEAALEQLADSLAASAAEFDFAVEQRDVAGATARCIVTTGRGEGAPVGTLCVADTGALLLVERPAGTLRATEYTADVADDAFELPAEPGT